MAGTQLDRAVAAPYEKDPQRARQDIAAQQAFMDAVGSIRKANVQGLPDLTEVMDHQGRRSTAIDEVLASDSDRVYLSPAFYDLAGDTQLPDRISFVPQPLLRLGREQSYRQVFFGALALKWFNTGREFTGQVAVKPILDEHIAKEMLLHEAAMYQYVDQLGISSLKVLGIMRYAQPRSKVAGFLLTAFDPGITTLDTLPWPDLAPEQAWGYASEAVDGLVGIHQKLIFHGDAEFKNTGIGVSESSTKEVDLESASSLRDCPENHDLLKRHTSADFSSLALSVGNFIFRYLPNNEKPRTDIQRFDILHNQIYEPYYERLVRTKGENLDVLVKAYDAMLAEKTAMAQGLW